MAMRRENSETVIEKVADLYPFQVGNVSGSWFQDGTQPDTGKLPVQWRRGLEDIGCPVYVAYSYKTPIAWYPAGAALWIIPDIHYSRTTLQHLSLVRQGARRRADRIAATLARLES
jgi:hypothetical protein